MSSQAPGESQREQNPRLALRAKQAAEAIGIGTTLLWEMTNRGEVPCVRIGKAVLYPVAMLEQWLAERAKKGGCR